MTTPVWDFLSCYSTSGTARFHMPGHKGSPLLGCEALDLTEIAGADSLYEASGILAESERNCSMLFSSCATFYSAEGSSLCIRAMLHLLALYRRPGCSRRIFAARNVHKSFVTAAALLDLPVDWLFSSAPSPLCSCPVSPEALEQALAEAEAPPAAVFLTSPDYLGGRQDLATLAEICHRHGTYLAVDNAHGAYLHFLPEPCHPLDLGADLCCDSAHKTLPVLTGGAYLHFSSRCPDAMLASVRRSLALFGSTSPSYLILASLDRCNAVLAEEFPQRLSVFLPRMQETRLMLEQSGCRLLPSDPLRLVLSCDGLSAAERLRSFGGEPEYADRDYLVLMLTPYNSDSDLTLLTKALGGVRPPNTAPVFPLSRPEPVLRLREALLAPQETLRVEDAVGRICADPSVSCPPAVPIRMPGERITEEAVEQFLAYGRETVSVVSV